MNNKIKTKKCKEKLKNDILPSYRSNAIKNGYTAQLNWVTRVPTITISSLVGSAECFPPAYISKIEDDKDCDLSGDIYIGGMHDNVGNYYDVVHCVRGGHNHGKKCMKTDTFLHQSGDCLSAFYHVDDKYVGRYWDPQVYEQMRESLAPDSFYNADDSQLSNLVSPIRKSIELVNS